LWTRCPINSNVPDVEHAARSIALIGVGRMGAVHALAIARHLPDVIVAAIAEPRAEAVAALGDLAAGAAVYDTAKQALAHPGLDACIVVTPTDTHAGVVQSALEEGLHVFCEKPLTLDSSESRALGARAADLQRVLQVGFWRRFHPPIAMAKQLLAEGAIGRPLLTKLTQWDVDCPPVEWCAPDRSGGIFVDMAIHEFDQIEWFLNDEIVAVEARPLPRVIGELDTVGDYDNAVILCALAGGGQAVIDVSRNGRYADDIRIEVLGSDGALFIETVPTGRLRLATREGVRTVWEDPEVDAFTAGIALELAAFTLAIGGRGDGPVPGADESIRASELGRAATRSAAAQRPEPTLPGR
jgi:myo-inositol 2-dehydrogenase/D-chiro-inositol 1-dehydrogenase